MRILVVEDDPATAKSLQLVLKQARANCDVTAFGEDAIEFAKTNDYDVILLDLNLPDCSGHAVLRTLRSAQVETPVLILSGSIDTDNKLKGFSSGADDYVTKPFNHYELVARIRAVVRRSQGHSRSILNFGALSIDLDRYVVAVGSQDVNLTNKEYEVVELLALSNGKTVSKDTILTRLYSGMDEPDAKIVDVYISKVRRKLRKASGHTHFIETVWGRGYALRPERCAAGKKVA